MQTPLSTNFSRGIISPKFHGRVETEAYHAGAAVIEDFIINNQGSLQRRPGTYRLWLTGFTAPSPEGEDEDRFAVEVEAGQRYSLLVVNDKGSEAQFILSKGGDEPEHRFFEVTIGRTNFDHQDDLFELTQFTEGDENFYPEAHAFATEDGSLVDDAFTSTISEVTFLRLRNPYVYAGFMARAWHKTISRDRCRAATLEVPFVSVGPLDPPEYVVNRSHLNHTTGFRVFDSDGNEIGETVHRTREIPHFVGQILKGQYQDARERSRLSTFGGARTVAQEHLIDDLGYVRLDVANGDPEDSDYVFYRRYPGRSRVYINGKSIRLAEANRNGGFVLIDFNELENAQSNWTELTDFRVRRTRRRKGKCTVLVFLVGCVKRGPTRWDYRTRSYTFPTDWLDQYQNREYDVEGTVWMVPEATFRLYYRLGPSEVMIGEISPENPTNDKWEIAETVVDTGGPVSERVSKIRIFSEADINPLTGRQLPDPSAEYILERILTEEEQDVISRRLKPWDRTEGIQDFALEIVSQRPEWVQDSVDRLQAGKTAIVHSGRLMMLEDENNLHFIVSAMRDYANFHAGDSEVDAYEFYVETERTERLQWAMSVRDGVIVGTDRNEYVVLGVESPSNVQARRYTGLGSSRPYAIRFGDKILFISRDGNRVVAYEYSDELAAWHSSDLTAVAEHLFIGGIQSMHYMQDPISSIWVVPEGNEGVYCLTWEPATGVQAWSHHMAGQNVLAATTATIDGVTALFVAVERQQMVSIEVLDFRAEGVGGFQYFIDSAEFLFWTWDDQEDEAANPQPLGPDGEVLDGETNWTVHFGTDQYSRFQGQDIAIVVNGVVERVLLGDLRPTSTTTLTIGPYEGADIKFDLSEDFGVTVGIGIPFTSKLETLPLLVESPSGPGVIKNTQTQSLRVRIDDSGTFKAGSARDELERVELTPGEDLWNVGHPALNRFTGDVRIPLVSQWSRRPSVFIESYYADPLNILALMSDSQVFE